MLCDRHRNVSTFFLLKLPVVTAARFHGSPSTTERNKTQLQVSPFVLLSLLEVEQ